MSPTFVGKNGRVYQRKFDHDEARERHAAGESLKDLAAEYGVTDTAVWLAVTPEDRERRMALQKAWRTTTCEVCGGPAMRLVTGKLKHNPDGRVLCIHCRGVVRRESVRFDKRGNLTAVRCMARDCANGERWQPAEVFPRGRRYPDLREGGFHNHCRACQTRMRQEHRERNAEPCVRCGSPRLSDREAAIQTRYRGSRGTGLCRSCYLSRNRDAA